MTLFSLRQHYIFVLINKVGYKMGQKDEVISYKQERAPGQKDRKLRPLMSGPDVFSSFHCKGLGAYSKI